MEVPQLWNERVFGKVEFVQVQSGMMSTSQDSRVHGIYGGVQFGLDKFNLRSRAAAPLGTMSAVARMPSAGLSASMQRQGLARFAPQSLMKGRVPSLAASVAPGAAIGAQSGMPLHRMGPLAMGRPMGASIGAAHPGRLQGVDLRLDSFDLSEAKRVSAEAQEGTWTGALKTVDECVAVGDTFWSSLEDGSQVFKDSDHQLLKAIFHPKLSDRRTEGDLFAPPDASHSYVARLRALVKEEEAVRKCREEHFISASFVMEKPGILFPFAWKACFENGTKAVTSSDTLIARPEYMEKAAELLQSALKESCPIFDKRTEEGMCYRIYSLGNLEVRTIQGVGGEETVGAVFSYQAAAKAAGPAKPVDEHERLVKATYYVERAGGSVKTSCPGAYRRYYFVVETAKGQKIRMERLATGEATWEVEPVDLADRNSMAKVIAAADCRIGLVVGDINTYQARGFKGDDTLPSPNACKHHSQKLFARATGVAAKRTYQSAMFSAAMLNNVGPANCEAMTNLVARCKQMARSQR